MDPFIEKLHEHGLMLVSIENKDEMLVTPKCQNSWSIERNFQTLFKERCNILIKDITLVEKKFSFPDKYRNIPKFLLDLVYLECITPDSEIRFRFNSFLFFKKPDMFAHIKANSEQYETFLQKHKLVSLFNTADPYHEFINELFDDYSYICNDPALVSTLSSFYTELYTTYKATASKKISEPQT